MRNKDRGRINTKLSDNVKEFIRLVMVETKGRCIPIRMKKANEKGTFTMTNKTITYK